MEWLPTCLDSCGKYAVVVIDNASTDNTVSFIRTNYPTIKVFEEKKNLGFGQANNKGISYALNNGADFVYLLNQDAYLEHNTIANLVQVQKKFPDYGIISPIHTNAQKKRLDHGFANYVNFKHNRDFYSDFVLNNPKKEIYTVPFVNAAGWLLSRKVLMQVGGFDPIFFHYGEDDNYCQRVRYHNFKIGVAPNSIMVHDRETRKKKDVLKFSPVFYQVIERGLKVTYGDLNNDLVPLENKIKSYKRQILKSYLKLDFKNVRNLHKLQNVYTKTLKEVSQSRLLNKRKLPNYLNLDNENN